MELSPQDLHQVTEYHNLSIVFVLTAGFGVAGILGYITHRLHLSPILGYLLAGYFIGPFSPGYIADLNIAEQLAEIGVVLMLFEVGLHFNLSDLLKVRTIAIPGALIQTFVAAVFSAWLIQYIGWPLESGIVIGLCVGVASTLVLVRMLVDNNLLNTTQGHISIGWLIVEDLLTVGVLILLPIIAVILNEPEFSYSKILSSIALMVLRFALLALIMFTLVSRFALYALTKIARTRSHELFTLGVLAIIFGIATSSAVVFGTSIALGAFIAGMVIGQTEVRHQASANSLAMKDAFVVLFFLTVGMLFNPHAIVENFATFSGVLFIILIIKPLTAFLIVAVLRYPVRTAFTVAIALAQIGEFSFILAEEALKFKFLPDDGFDIIVACALVSICLNPLLFKLIDPLSRYFSIRGEAKLPSEAQESEHKAVLIGFGPIGQSVYEVLERIGFATLIIEQNIDTVQSLRLGEKHAIFGDAGSVEILHQAKLETASLLVITTPEIQATLTIIKLARILNPDIPIVVRVRFMNDEPKLADLNVDYVCCEREAIKAYDEIIFKYANLAS